MLRHCQAFPSCLTLILFSFLFLLLYILSCCDLSFPHVFFLLITSIFFLFSLVSGKAVPTHFVIAHVRNVRRNQNHKYLALLLPVLLEIAHCRSTLKGTTSSHLAKTLPIVICRLLCIIFTGRAMFICCYC